MFESGGDDSTQTSVWSGVNQSANVAEGRRTGNLTNEVVVNSEDSESWPSISDNMSINRPANHTSGTVTSGASGSDMSPPGTQASGTGHFPTGVSTSSVGSSLAYSIASPIDANQRSSWSNSLGNTGSSWNPGGDGPLWRSAADAPVSRDGVWSNIGSTASGGTTWSTDLGGGGNPSSSAALWGDRGLTLSSNGHAQQHSVSQAQGATSPSAEWTNQAVSRSNSLPWGGTSPPASVWSDPSAFDSSSVADSQTWAQAVGKSLPINAAGDTSNNGSVSKTPEPVTDERDRIILQVINSNDGWGRNSVDQSAPWDLSELRSNRIKQMDSNVWPNEPPNGTGIWDAYYSNSAEKSNRWQPQSSTSWSGDTSGSVSAWPNEPHSGNDWDSGSTGASRGARGIGAGGSGSGGGGGGGGGGGYWNDKPMLQSSMSWDPQDSMAGKRCNMWMDDRSGVPNSGTTGTSGGGGSAWNDSNWMGGNRRGQENENWGGQWDKSHDQTFWNSQQRSSGGGNGGNAGSAWNENHWSGNSMENVAKWTSSSDPDYGGRRGVNQQQAPYGRINSRPEQQMRVHAMKQLMHMGFKKEEAQHALITHNMDVDRAIADLLSNRERELAQQNSVSGLLHGDQGNLPPGPNNLVSSGQQGDFNFGGPRSRHHVAGNNNSQMGSGPMSMNSSNQAHPHQQQQQQQLMRQHIAQQLRMAVQNRLINPNMLNANLTNRELVPFQQLLQCQNSVNIQRQRLTQVQQQMQMASPSNNPVLLSQLRQQHDMLLQNINASQTQIKLLSQNLNTLRSGGNSGNGQPSAATPQGSRGGGVEASELSSRLAELRFANNQQHSPNQQQQMMQHSHWNRGIGDLDGHSGNSKLHNVQSSPNLQQGGLPMQPNAYSRAMSMQPSVSDPAFAAINEWGQDGESMVPTTGLDSAVAAAVDIPEFVPGQPWQGISSNNSAEDPNMTLGSVRPGLLSLNNDHLERLSTNNDGAKSGNRSTPCGTSIGGRNWAPDKSAFSPVTGGNQQMQPSNYLLVRNMFPSVSVDIVKAVCQQHGQLANLQPNLHAGWVLVRFVNREDAVRAQRFMANRLGTVDFVSDGDASRYMGEIQALATRFVATAGNHASTPGAGAASTPLNFHSPHLPQQSRPQQSQLGSADSSNGDLGQSSNQQMQPPSENAGGNGAPDTA